MIVPKKQKTAEKVVKVDGSMPLNKYIAQAGICSRRNAVELIKGAHVRVNGQVIKEPGHKVTSEDTVKVHSKLIKQVKPDDYVYVVLNKPRGTVTTASDELGRPSVVDLVKLPKKHDCSLWVVWISTPPAYCF